MKSFAMLWTRPIGGDFADMRWFIDGRRVTQDEYEKLVSFSARQDTFQSYRFAGRWHNRSVVYR